MKGEMGNISSFAACCTSDEDFNRLWFSSHLQWHGMRRQEVLHSKKYGVHVGTPSSLSDDMYRSTQGGELAHSLAIRCTAR